MSRVHTIVMGAISIALAGTLVACTSSDQTAPRPAATVPTAPTEKAAAAAPGAAALGVDPTTSPAGKAVDTVDWMTPVPSKAREFLESPDGCHQDGEKAALVSCVLGDPKGDVDVRVVGDSKTRQWVPALEVAAKELGWRLTVSTKSACPFTTAEAATGGIRGPYPSCDEWNKSLLAEIKRDKPDIVINALYKMRAKVTETGTREDAREAMIAGVSDAVAQVSQTGAKVILFGASPMNATNVPECVEKHPDQLTKCATPRDKAFGADVTWDEASVQRVLSAADGTQLVDLNDYLCPSSSCAPVIGNILVYRDKHHVTVPYMRTMAPMLLKSLKSLDLN